MTDDLVEKVALEIEDYISRACGDLLPEAAAECARLVFSAIEAAGFVIVPVEITNEMALAAYGRDLRDGMWEAMLSARPRITGGTT